MTVKQYVQFTFAQNMSSWTIVQWARSGTTLCASLLFYEEVKGFWTGDLTSRSPV